MKQSFQQFSILASIAIFSVIMIASQGMLEPAYGTHAFEDFTAEYDFVAGIHSEVTFKFRNGIETVNFPVFSTTSDLIDNVGTSFVVEGVIGNSPHLHKALDDAYTYRNIVLTGAGSFDYEHRYFDIDINVVQNETILKSFEYNNCEISANSVSTLTDDYESYLASNTGFAVVDSVEFRCSGVHINLDNNSSSPTHMDMTLTDYGSLPFPLAEDVRTFLTFDFDHGAEKIESVIFTLTAGFDENDNAGANFQIITAVLPHPLIDNAISKSQKLSGQHSSFNEDFDVLVEFVNPDTTLRGLDFNNCIVSGYDILTLRDKEEGYTGKRGFATAEILDVDCSGLTPINPNFEKLSKDKKSLITPIFHSYNMGTGPHVIATFDFDGGIEVIDFPEFNQGNLISKANPTFELVGVPGVTPLLYNEVDEAKKSQSKITGVTSQKKLFDVNLTLVNGDHTVRSFDYSKCRIVDYVLKTEHDLEESFYKGFALTNEFNFECQGYAPVNSHYGEMFSIPKSTDTESSMDYESKQRSTWGPNFRVS
jgi:hypothetical protein